MENKINMAKRFIDTGFLDQKWIRKYHPKFNKQWL